LHAGFTGFSLLTGYTRGHVRPPNAVDLFSRLAEVLVTFPGDVVGLLSGHRLVHGLTRLETWVFVVGMAHVAVVAFARRWRRSERESPRNAHLLLALWLFVPLLVIAQHAAARPYHFELLYPAPILAGAALLAATLRRLTVSRRSSAVCGRVAIYAFVGALV